MAAGEKDWWQDNRKHQKAPKLLGSFAGQQPALTLDRENYALYVGNRDFQTFAPKEIHGSFVTITATLHHQEFTAQDICWQLSDERLGTLVVNGAEATVYAEQTGQLTLSASLPYGPKATCCLPIIDNLARKTPQRLQLNTEHLRLAVGHAAQLTPFVYPKDYFHNDYLDVDLTYTSSDETVACVQQGLVTPLKVGKCQITVSDARFGVTASCLVEVQGTIRPQKLKATSALLTSKVGEKHTLLNPFGDSPVTFTPEDEGLLAVDQTGRLTALGNSCVQEVTEEGMKIRYQTGTTRLLATNLYGGEVFTYEVTVLPEEQELHQVILSSQEENLLLGKDFLLAGLLAPAPFLHQGLVFVNETPEVLQLTAAPERIDGAKQVTVTPLKVGTGRIAATFKGLTQRCTFHVLPHTLPLNLTDLQLPVELALLPDEVLELQTQLAAPLKAPLCLASSDETHFTADAFGHLKGYQTGRAALYLWLENDVTVRKAVAEGQFKLGMLTGKNYRKIAVTVQDSSPYLRNLHVVPEALAENSCLCLWNRASLTAVPDFAHYLVYLDNRLVLQTDKLGCTLDCLKAETTYQVTVTALDRLGQQVASEQISIKTLMAKKILNVLDFGAYGDGRHLDTYAIQQAVNACPPQGIVLLPKGHTFLSGALFLKSDLTLQIDGCLLGSDNATHYPWVITKWEGWRGLPQAAAEWPNAMPNMPKIDYLRASLINIGVYDEGISGLATPYHTHNVVLKGCGQINANGFSLSYSEGPNGAVQEAGTGYQQVAKPSPIKNGFMRGRAIAAHNVDGLYVKDLLVAYSPSWSIHLIHCQHVTLNHLEVVTQGNGEIGLGAGGHKARGHILNGDGVDPESCLLVNIFDCYFTTGDDAVTLKCGRNKEGNELNRPSAYVRITDCVTHNSTGGFGAGSEIAAGVHDILYQNLTGLNLSLCGIWFKTLRWRGGHSAHLQIKDLTVVKAKGAIGMTFDHSKGGPTNIVNPADELPGLRDVVIENVTGQATRRGIYFSGLPEAKITAGSIKDYHTHDVIDNTLNCCSGFDLTQAGAINWVLTDCQAMQLPPNHKESRNEELK